MKVYHIEVIHDDGWYVGRVLDRPEVTTQGANLDELVYMLRDAIQLMWNEKNVQFELIVSPKIKGRAITPGVRLTRTKTAGKRRKSAA